MTTEKSFRPTYRKGYEARNNAATIVLVPDHVAANLQAFADKEIPIKHVLGQRGFDGKVSGKARLIGSSIGEDELRVVLLYGSCIADKPVRLVGATATHDGHLEQD